MENGDQTFEEYTRFAGLVNYSVIDTANPNKLEPAAKSLDEVEPEIEIFNQAPSRTEPRLPSDARMMNYAGASDNYFDDPEYDRAPYDDDDIAQTAHNVFGESEVEILQPTSPRSPAVVDAASALSQKIGLGAREIASRPDPGIKKQEPSTGDTKANWLFREDDLCTDDETGVTEKSFGQKAIEKKPSRVKAALAKQDEEEEEEEVEYDLSDESVEVSDDYDSDDYEEEEEEDGDQVYDSEGVSASDSEYSARSKRGRRRSSKKKGTRAKKYAVDSDEQDARQRMIMLRKNLRPLFKELGIVVPRKKFEKASLHTQRRMMKHAMYQLDEAEYVKKRGNSLRLQANIMQAVLSTLDINSIGDLTNTLETKLLASKRVQNLFIREFRKQAMAELDGTASTLVSQENETIYHILKDTLFEIGSDKNVCVPAVITVVQWLKDALDKMKGTSSDDQGKRAVTKASKPVAYRHKEASGVGNAQKSHTGDWVRFFQTNPQATTDYRYSAQWSELQRMGLGQMVRPATANDDDEEQVWQTAIRNSAATAPPPPPTARPTVPTARAASSSSSSPPASGPAPKKKAGKIKKKKKGNGASSSSSSAAAAAPAADSAALRKTVVSRVGCMQKSMIAMPPVNIDASKAVKTVQAYTEASMEAEKIETISNEARGMLRDHESEFF